MSIFRILFILYYYDTNLIKYVYLSICYGEKIVERKV